MPRLIAPARSSYVPPPYWRQSGKECRQDAGGTEHRIQTGSDAVVFHNLFTQRCLIAIIVVITLPIPCAAQVSLVQDGQARGVIVTADEPTPTAQYAAEELVRHVERATGLTLPVFAESDAPADAHTRVYLGETEEASRRGIDTARLPREAYVLRSIGNDLFIVGRESDANPLEQNNPDAGTLFGVYEFIERVIGARWLWPGELGAYVPRSDTVEIWSLNETAAPSLAFRSLNWGRMHSLAAGSGTVDAEDVRTGFSEEVARDYARALEILLRRHRMGGIDARPHTSHATTGWWGKYGEEHPEWFALRRDGTRGHPEPDYVNVPMCVTNEGLHDFILEQWDGESVLQLGEVDRPGRCICDHCRAWDGPQPDPPPWFAERLYRGDHRAQQHFDGQTSDRYARFWKTIYEKAAERNPNVDISVSFLFENEFTAPVTGIKLNNHIYGDFVQWLDPHIRYFPMPDEAFDWLKNQWTGWRETGIRLGYRPNYLHDGYVMPHFETRQSGAFFQFAQQHGMEGADFDSLTGQWAAQGLRLYMHLRLLGKPDLDLDTIRAEYLSAFGPAADTMDRYFDYWETYAVDNNLRFIEMYRDVGWRYRSYVMKAHEAYPPECFEPAEALLEQALEEAGNDPLPEFADRVRFIQTGLQHAQLATKLTAVFNGQEIVPADRVDDAKAALAELVAFRKAHEREFFSDLLHVTSFWERAHLSIDAIADLMDEE